MIRIVIAKEFSDTPGGRFIKEGNFSGEEFREALLYPRLKSALDSKDYLEINFDDCFGFSTSFLEEAFGGLVRKLKVRGLLKNIKIVSRDDETIEETIQKYVFEAEKLLSE